MMPKSGTCKRTASTLTRHDPWAWYIPDMSTHRFLDHLFPPNGEQPLFETRSAILIPQHYPPSILFLGTYNDSDDAIKKNTADFFYGRNYFWPVWRRLFGISGATPCTMGMRKSGNNMQEIPLMEGEGSIYSMCTQGKMTFADLISRVNAQLRSHSDEELRQAHDNGQVEWSTPQIIQYLRETTSIRYVRSTRQMHNSAPWQQHWEALISADYRRKIDFGHIHTPSGNGLGMPGVPKCEALAGKWMEQLPPDYLAEVGAKM